MRRKTPSSPGKALHKSIWVVLCALTIVSFSIISKLEVINTHGKSISRLSGETHFSETKHFLCPLVLFPSRERVSQLWCSGICNSLNNSISELYLDFAHQDFTTDLIRFFKSYPGSNLKVLEVRGMDDPMDLDVVSSECPNLVRLKMMLSGVFIENKLFWMYFSKLSRYPSVPIWNPLCPPRFHIKTSSADTLLSFMKFNISVTELRISCPNEVKSKFTDGKQMKKKENCRLFL